MSKTSRVVTSLLISINPSVTKLQIVNNFCSYSTIELYYHFLTTMLRRFSLHYITLLRSRENPALFMNNQKRYLLLPKNYFRFTNSSFCSSVFFEGRGKLMTWRKKRILSFIHECSFIKIT